MLEKMIYNRLILFINKRNILKYAQHGVTANKLPEMDSQIFIENIQESMDKHVYISGLFFDLTKAYDVIIHEILFNKLEYYGIRGTIKTGIESCLLYQSQFVEIFKTHNTRRNRTYISIHIRK